MAEENKNAEPSEMSLQANYSGPQKESEERSNSPELSCLSMRSEQSMDPPVTFKETSVPQKRESEERSNSPELSCLSMRSEQSMDPPVTFKETSVPQKRENSGLSEHPEHPHFHVGEGDTSTRDSSDTNGSEAAVRGKKLQKKINDLLRIFDDLEKKIIVLVKHELEMYKKLLRKENSKFYGETKEDMWNLKDGVLNITLLFLTMMKHEDLAEALQDALIEVQQRALKSRLIQKYQRVYEGIAKQGEFNILKKIYTDLYITEGGTGQGNKEHEVRRIEKNQMQQEVPIKCENMFEPLPEQDKPIQTVLTQGVAGIGKSICVQKFILDWAEGKEYQDIHLIFPLPFRELNLKKGTHSLMEIIYFFFPETKGLRLTDQHKVMFIFDGLDECKLPLAFQENEIWNNVSLKAPLDVVMTNLIKGNLLPSALIWITSRPAAASKIPPDCINRVTEVRGFNDDQKEEYFRKRIKDKKLAQDIIDHIKQSRSLFIMCHIPVFCWISATVLQNFLEEQEGKDTPKTLTEMYTSFLIFQTIQNNIKYTGQNVDDTPWDKEGILSLGKLAFQNLEENDLIFYENSLKECGIDPRKKSVYSGLYTQEHVRFLGTVFSFVHLSIQEFLAALFAYLCATNDKKNVLDHQPSLQENKEAGVIVLLKIAVDKALESEHGHMDLFLRFLLGLSMESNRKLLRGLLTQTGNVPDCRKEIVEYIKFKLDKDRQNMSAERSINLFYCLHELNDDSLVKEIQRYMSSGSLSEAELSPVQWSALVFVLLTSKNKLEVFDLQKFIKSDECLNRLLPVVQDATSALLNECNLTERSCSALCRVLSSETSRLTRLDLSNNKLCDSGIEQLSKGLSSSTCKLKELRLSFCHVTKKGYDALATALKSNHLSNLTTLDLRGNDPGDEGVKLLTDLQNSPDHKLEKIMLLKSSAAEKACDFLGKLLGENPLLLRELDLSGKIQGDQAVKQLSALLEDPHCRPETIKLNHSSITEQGCVALSAGLCSNPSHLKVLDLSENKLYDAGVKQICDLLKKPECGLLKLKLSDCSIREKGYADLASALESNTSSHLIQLDLRKNNPGETGVQLLTDLLESPNSQLQELRLLMPDVEKTCALLTKYLGKTPLLLEELELSEKIQGDSEVQQLSALMKDTHCRAKKLKLRNSNITEKGCKVLSVALCSNLSHLIVLDLSLNELGNAGLQQLCVLLKNKNCILQILGLSFCSITEEGYDALASALNSNPFSHLIELDLRGNDPGDKGVKLITDVQKCQNCKLKTIRLLESSAAEEACDFLTEVLGVNPLLLKELDLSGKIQGDQAVEQLSALLEDQHCRPETIKLNSSSISEEGCAALSSALCSNPSHLKDLDLSGNELGISGVKQICILLKSQNCKLKVLKLSSCSIKEDGYAELVLTLKSNPSSHLTDLDLSQNDPGDKGVELMYSLLKSPHFKLKKLRLLKSSDAEEACDVLEKVLGLNPLLLKELDLSGKIQGDQAVKQLSALLEDPHCRPETIKLNSSSVTEDGCAALSAALCLNPSHLKELDLHENKLKSSGVEKLCTVLQKPDCKLQKLILSSCSVEEEGYTALASSLKSNPSVPLIELDLRGNDPGDTGVKPLIDLLVDPNYKLNILRLLRSSAAEEVCASLTKSLRTSPLLLTELDLSGKKQGDLEIKKLSDLLEDSHCRPKKLRLCNSSITANGCATLASALCSNSSQLKELDLSENELGSSGVQHLCALLNKEICTLEILRISDCNVTEEGYAALASALKSNPSSHLNQLDLRGNDPGANGVKELICLKDDQCCKLKLEFLKTEEAVEACVTLTEVLRTNPLLLTELDLSGKIKGDPAVKRLCYLLKDSHCKINLLRLHFCEIKMESCSALAEVLSSKHSHLKELDLSNNDLQDSEVKQLFAEIKNSQSPLKIIRLGKCSITEDGCAALASALGTNLCQLTELDLRENKFGDAGLMHLSDLLMSSNCKLENLNVSDNNITEKGYIALASVLKSSHLKRLDLSGNNPGDKGIELVSALLQDPQCKVRLLKDNAEEACDLLTKVLGKNPLLVRELDLRRKIQGDQALKQLSALLEDPHCQITTLGLKNISITEKGCADLASALCKNPSHLRELNLSGNQLGGSGINDLCQVLGDTRFKLLKLQLNNSNIAQKGCAALSLALSSNPSHLKDLDLSGNHFGHIGVQSLCDILINSNCTLEKLNISACDITEEGYDALASALKSNSSSHLTELDLRENFPGDKGVKLINDLLNHPNCKIKTLRVLKNAAAEEACDFLTEILGKNPLLLRELDLSGKIQGDPAVKQLSALLEDPHCILKQLKLNNCSITEDGCAALSSALSLNPLHLIELDLSENKLENSGVKRLTCLLQNSKCKLELLNLSDCCITEGGYVALKSALKSSCSPCLKELILKGNDPGDTGVKLLTDVQKDPNSKLMILRLLKTPAAEEAWNSLSKDLETNLLLQKKLELRRSTAGKSGDLRVKQLCHFLKDTHCKLKKLQINNDELTEESCAALSAVLPFTSLTELDLSNNNLQDSGVKNLCKGLSNPLCKLEILRLSCCSVTEEGYALLASTLQSNQSSHLKELDLRGNNPGKDIGSWKRVENIITLFDRLEYKQKTLRLLKDELAQQACDFLTKQLQKNPLLMKNLDLSINKEFIEMRQLTALLEDPHCRLEKLTLYKSDKITENNCNDLVAALTVNPSHLRELDMKGNTLGEKALFKLCHLLTTSLCCLEKLNLSHCCINEEGYLALARALKSNPSQLLELDLTGNTPGEKGVKQLIDVLKDKTFKLNTLRLLSSAADEACTGLTSFLGTNPLIQTELNLSGKRHNDSFISQLSALIKDSHCILRKLKLKNSSITWNGYAVLSSALCSKTSRITELDLSENNLGNSEVQLLCSLLKNQQCKLQKLGLSFCSIREEGYTALASALKLSNSSLTELDLRGNDPGRTGVRLMTSLKNFPNCKRITVRLLESPAAEEACDFLTKVLGENPLLLKELDLSGKIQGDQAVKQLSDLLEDSHCIPETLKIRNSNITKIGCEALSAALCSNPSYLEELDLSGNGLGNTGVKWLCTLLKCQSCKLHKLSLSDCSLTENGYAALALALKSKPSPTLKELDLRGNDPGNTGVKQITDIFKGSGKTLRLLKTNAAEDGLKSLKTFFKKDPLQMTELNLSEKEPKDIRVEQLCALLEDPHYRLQKLRLYKKGSITDQDCAALISAISVKRSQLKDLDLNQNEVGKSALEGLCTLLNNPKCDLEKINLSFCCITEEGYAYLASALKSSNLLELDLRGNNPGEKGVKLLTDLLMDSKCKLKNLRMLTDAAEKACNSLPLELKSNALLLKELDINIKGDSVVEKLCDLLKDLHCTLKILRLKNSEITEKGCAALSSALESNPSHLIELDLSGNKLGNLGVEHLSHLLKKPECKIEQLSLSFCSIEMEGYAALGSALKFNSSSHLKELDLRGNDPGAAGNDTAERKGLDLLNDLQMDSKCSLKKLRLLKDSAAEEACVFMTGVLGTNPIPLTKLDLSGKIQEDSEMKQFSILLQDLHFRPKELKLKKSNITEKGCNDLAEALCLNPSHLIELDLSENNLGNSGVNKLCLLLSKERCNLQKLYLSYCNISEEGYGALASALRSNTKLMELDLRGNHPGDRGVEQFYNQPNKSYLKLRLMRSEAAEEGLNCLNILDKNILKHKELDLRENTTTNIPVTQLCAVIEDPHCSLKKFMLYKTGKIRCDESAALISALNSKPAHLKHLDLNANRLDKSGVQNLCTLLRNSDCKVDELMLKCIGIKEKGCADLISALTSNPSHLRELDLYKNELGKSGLQNICSLLEKPTFKLESLKLGKKVTDKDLASLASALCTNPSHIRKLDLSKNTLKDSEMKEFSTLLKNQECKLQKLLLNKCRIKEKGCEALISALNSNPSHLRELDLTDNKLGKLGFQNLIDLLSNPQCKLEKLRLKNCGIDEEGCDALTSALNSNPTHLKELDLRKNPLGKPLKHLAEVLKKSKCQLKVDRSLLEWGAWLISYVSPTNEEEESSGNEDDQTTGQSDVDKEKTNTDQSETGQSDVDTDKKNTDQSATGQLQGEETMKFTDVF